MRRCILIGRLREEEEYRRSMKAFTVSWNPVSVWTRCSAASVRFVHHSHDAILDLPPTIQSPRYHGAQNGQNLRKLLCLDPYDSSNYYNLCIPGVRNRSHLPKNGLFQHSARRDTRYFRHSPKVLSSGSYSVLQAKGLQHWFKNWQELRRQKLTASTFGGAVGLWRGRRVQLWLEKLGLIQPFTGNLATCWNNIQEEVALEKYNLITGRRIIFPGFQIYNKRNPEDDWLAASPDGVVGHAYPLPFDGVLEIKCPFFAGEVEKASPWSRIPLYYMPQAQGLMEILDRNWLDLYCWTPNGSSLFRVQRDPQYWELLKLALSDFWWKHVMPAMEICSKTSIKDPITELKCLKPAPKHELCNDIVYASKCAVDNSKLLLREIHGRLLNQ